MTATDELRRLLDERGVEWVATTGASGTVWTHWNAFNGHRIHAMDNGDGTVEIFGEWDVTPAQAIAATLGAEHKFAEAEEWLRKFQREHDELRIIGPNELWALAAALHDDIPFGYEASMRLADWLFHASLGPGTCTVKCFDDGIDEALDGSPIYTTPTWYLSCGHTCGGAERPSFCPNCGRKVVQA